MLVQLPDGSYYVPAMLHSPKRSKPEELPSVEMVKKKITVEMEHQRRVYEFNMLPFGLIDRIVVGILHFPGMEVHPSTWENLFYLTGENSHVLLRAEEDHQKITIDLFYATRELKNVQFNLFHQFLFNSPKELLHAYPARQVTNVFVFLNGRSMGNEKELYSRLLETGDDEIRQFFLPSIPLVNGNTATIEKKLGQGGFGIVWLGSTLVDGERQTVVFKELMNANACESFIQEVIMMQQLQNKYNVKLFGICFPSTSLLSSRAKWIGEGENNPSNLFMVLEFAPYKDLVHCKEELQEKSISLKLKIALDVARGLLCLHQQGGAKLIHRDVKTENIFVYSLNEETIFEEESIHAKLGDFGTVVVACPSYSQRIGNYQNTAPEALKGTIDVPYSSSIDVYSFAIVLWELFSGKVPFKELQVEDPIKAIVGGYRPPLDFLPPDLPKEIITMITTSWQADPTQRCS